MSDKNFDKNLDRGFKILGLAYAIVDRWRAWRAKRAEVKSARQLERIRGPARCLETGCDRVRGHEGVHKRGDVTWGGGGP